MKDGLYHYQIGLPLPETSFQFGTVGLTYTKHARSEAIRDRYGAITLPDTLNTSKSKVIEVEIVNRRVNKIVYRTAYNQLFDLIIVVALGGRVKTVWLNSKTDKHKTLDYSKYNQTVKRVS